MVGEVFEFESGVVNAVANMWDLYRIENKMNDPEYIIKWEWNPRESTRTSTRTAFSFASKLIFSSSLDISKFQKWLQKYIGEHNGLVQVYYTSNNKLGIIYSFGESENFGTLLQKGRGKCESYL